MLKTSSTELAKAKKGGVRIGDNSKAGHDGMNNIKVDGDKVGDEEVWKKGWKMSKSKKMVGSDFLTPIARLAFNILRQVFIKALILHHFNLKHHIRIKTDV